VRNNQLTEREKRVLELRTQGLTLSEVAELTSPLRGQKNAQNENGVTRERIRQIEAKALEKLRLNETPRD